MLRISLLFWIGWTMLWSITANTTPQITVTPASALYDTPVNIVVTGLPPETEATIRAGTTTSVFIYWESEATFMTDSEGRINLGTQAPISGTYTGVDPMGLFWSMYPPDLLPFPFTHDFDTPLSITFAVLLQGETVAEATIERLGSSPEIERIDIVEQVGDYGLRGTLFLPPGDAPHPAVIVLGGSEGGLPARYAARLASHGYATLALAYFNYDDLPANVTEIPLEYFDSAVTWLRQYESVAPQSIGMIGLSKGAEAALLVGSRQDNVQAIIAISPTHLIWQGLESGSGRFLFMSSWSIDGEPVDYTRFVRAPVSERITESGAIRYAGVYDRAMAQTQTEPIPVENITAPVLLISGEDDQAWSAAFMGEQIRETMEAANGTVTHLIYPDAGHIPALAYTPTAYAEELNLPFQQAVAFGGTLEGNAHYASDSWTQILMFLATYLDD